MLAFGEVRVGPGELAFGCESLTDVSPARRTLYERAVALAGLDPGDVLVVSVSAAGVEVHFIDFDDAGWPLRTWHVAPEHCAGRRTGSSTERTAEECAARTRRRPPVRGYLPWLNR